MDCFQRSCTMKRGIRQGCPISAFLYLFLSIKIKKIIQYMDLLKKNYKMKFKKKHATCGQYNGYIWRYRIYDSMKHAINTRNKCCKFIAFRFYKYKMYWKIKNLERTSQSLRMSIRENTLSFCSLLSLLHSMKEEKISFQTLHLHVYYK